ncbi:MAG: methyltransferase domain-containing protein [Candidatus Omnitrophica bacterium]|nr:methyltransferase domain-containing protein [Candidatus Omnitrophota bacterium]
MKKNSCQKNHKAGTRDWFDNWSNEYDRTLGSIGFHRELLDLVVKYAKAKSGDRVLDIGCGTGLLSLRFIKKGCYVYGIDNSGKMLDIFRDKLKRLGVRHSADCRLMDASAARLPRAGFDIAVSSVTLHHLKEKSGLVKKVYNALKPNGSFIIGEVDMDTTGRHTDVSRLRRILNVLEQEWILALRDAGIEAFSKMYDNGKKHILNQGEYCISLKQWEMLCRDAGFGQVGIKLSPNCGVFGIVIAKKTT